MFKKKRMPHVPDVIPAHIAIIMDGNGRWASKRRLPRTAGHKAGAETFKTITRYASSIGVKHLTMYAFSTENWKRPSDEVNALQILFKQYLQDALQNFLDENIKVKFLGDIRMFSSDLQKLIEDVIEVSSKKTGMVLNLAMNYGGRAELIHAFNGIMRDMRDGRISQKITEETISEHLYTAGQPDPDLIIRPSGEQRLSNFLTWQCAYSELVFCDILWPDFKPKDLDEAIEVFSNRQRRFGGV